AVPGTTRENDDTGVIDPDVTASEPTSSHLPTSRTSPVIGLIRACRPKQWSKNVLVFFGLIFALKLADPQLVLRSLAAFAVFCAASSGVYLFNDLADVEKDRQHPTKRNRPLAAGIVTPRQVI